jgi:hypothetical protein
MTNEVFPPEGFDGLPEVTVKPGLVNGYLSQRSREIDPHMPAIRGFLGRIVLRSLTDTLPGLQVVKIQGQSQVTSTWAYSVIQSVYNALCRRTIKETGR